MTYAFKHAVLTHQNSVPRRITSADARITSSTGYGRMAFGEGKFGEVEQVIVTLNDGTERTLSSILQNAADAWRAAMGRPLPPMSEQPAGAHQRGCLVRLSGKKLDAEARPGQPAPWRMVRHAGGTRPQKQKDPPG